MTPLEPPVVTLVFWLWLLQSSAVSASCTCSLPLPERESKLSMENAVDLVCDVNLLLLCLWFACCWAVGISTFLNISITLILSVSTSNEYVSLPTKSLASLVQLMALSSVSVWCIASVNVAVFTPGFTFDCCNLFTCLSNCLRSFFSLFSLSRFTISSGGIGSPLHVWGCALCAGLPGPNMIKMRNNKSLAVIGYLKQFYTLRAVPKRTVNVKSFANIFYRHTPRFIECQPTFLGVFPLSPLSSSVLEPNLKL